MHKIDVIRQYKGQKLVDRVLDISLKYIPEERSMIEDCMIHFAMNRSLEDCIRAVDMLDCYDGEKVRKIANYLQFSSEKMGLVECFEQEGIKKLFAEYDCFADIKAVWNYRDSEIMDRFGKVAYNSENKEDALLALSHVAAKTYKENFEQYLNLIELDSSIPTLEFITRGIKNNGDAEKILRIIQKYTDPSLERFKDLVFEGVGRDPKISSVYLHPKILDVLKNSLHAEMADTLRVVYNYSNYNKAVANCEVFKNPKMAKYVIKDFIGVGRIHASIQSEKTLEILETVDEDFIPLLAKFKGKKDVAYQIYKKYHGIFDVKHFIQMNNTKYDDEELLNDVAYKAIKSSASPLNKAVNICLGKYSQRRLRIKNSSIMSYDELDKIHETNLFVHAIHNNRLVDDLIKIEKGFYSELNRAILQGKNDRERIANVHKYCNEVKKQMADNINELMVVNNA